VLYCLTYSFVTIHRGKIHATKTTDQLQATTYFALCFRCTTTETKEKPRNLILTPSGIQGARGSLVGRGTMLKAGKSRVRVPMRWNFSSFQSHYGHGVDSAPNRNEYHESSWGVKGGWRVRLTTLPPSVSRLSRENVGASTSHNPMGLHGLLQGELYLTYRSTEQSPTKIQIYRTAPSCTKVRLIARKSSCDMRLSTNS
jgi:hypothetical protein